jgi:hypothetical protein
MFSQPAYSAKLAIMDERFIKRLLVILAVSIIAIVLIKVALTKTYTNLNNAAAIKKQAASAQPSDPQQTPTPPATAITDIPATSSAGETTTAELPASSSVSEVR